MTTYATTAPAERRTVAEAVNDAEDAHPLVYAAVTLGAAAWYGLTWWLHLPARLLALLGAGVGCWHLLRR